jgi:O-antigen ligase
MTNLADAALLLSVPILFVVGLRRPDRLLLMWLLLSPLAHNTIFFGHDFRVVSFDRLALFASLLSLLGNGQLQQLVPRRLLKLEKTAIIFILVFMGEALVSFPPRDAFSKWTRALDLFGIPFYLYLLIKYLLLRDGTYNERLERRMVMILGIVSFYSAAMAVYEHFTSIDLFPRIYDGLLLRQALGKPRANGPFGVAEVMGLYLSLTLLLCLYRWKVCRLPGSHARVLPKVFTVPYTLLLVAGIYSTMFRNVWGGFFGGYSIRHLLNRKRRGVYILVAVILTIVGALFWQTFADTNIYKQRVSNVENIHDRLNAWLYAFRAFSEHPFVGIGYAQLKHYIRGAQARGDDLRIFEEIKATYHPHNTVIAMLGENGLLLTIPFILLFWYFLTHVRGCVRLARSTKDVEFGLLAMGGAFTLLAPHVSDRCLAWDKYNNLLFLFFALVVAHHVHLLRARIPVPEETQDPHGDRAGQSTVSEMAGAKS